MTEANFLRFFILVSRIRHLLSFVLSFNFVSFFVRNKKRKYHEKVDENVFTREKPFTLSSVYGIQRFFSLTL